MKKGLCIFFFKINKFLVHLHGARAVSTNNRAWSSGAFATSHFFLQELSQLLAFSLSLSSSLSRKCNSCTTHLLHLSPCTVQKCNQTEVTLALPYAMIMEPTLPLLVSSPRPFCCRTLFRGELPHSIDNGLLYPATMASKLQMCISQTTRFKFLCS